MIYEEPLVRHIGRLSQQEQRMFRLKRNFHPSAEGKAKPPGLARHAALLDMQVPHYKRLLP
jgi:hypothetical protein